MPRSSDDDSEAAVDARASHTQRSPRVPLLSSLARPSTRSRGNHGAATAARGTSGGDAERLLMAAGSGAGATKASHISTSNGGAEARQWAPQRLRWLLWLFLLLLIFVLLSSAVVLSTASVSPLSTATLAPAVHDEEASRPPEEAPTQPHSVDSRAVSEVNATPMVGVVPDGATTAATTTPTAAAGGVTFEPARATTVATAVTLPSPSPHEEAAKKDDKREGGVESTVAAHPLLPATLSTTAATADATTTTATAAGASTTMMMKFAAVALPRVPASWADGGGGSVRVRRAFTVLTVSAGAPLPAADAEVGDADRAGAAGGGARRGVEPQQEQQWWLLRRAARGLCTAGVTRHDAFHEWLVVHPAHVTAAASATAAGAVHGVWRRQAGHCPAASRDGRSLIYVAGMPHGSGTRVHARTTAAALLYGVRIVESTFVVVHDLHRVLLSVPVEPRLSQQVRVEEMHAGIPPNPPSPSADVRENTTAQLPVAHAITVALQTMSLNDFPSLSHVVVDDTRVEAADGAADAAGVDSDVHAFRLQVYVTGAHRQREREGTLQQQLIAYVKRVTQVSITNDNPTALSTTSTRAAAASAMVEDGLPISVYSTSPHFHCQRAPLYNVRVVVPPWMRAARHHQHTTSTLFTTAGDADANEGNAHNVGETHLQQQPQQPTPPSSPPLSTLCEVLLSRHSEMPVGFAAEGLSFHRNFCQEWQQLALLPSPVSPDTQQDAPANPLQGLLNPANGKGANADAADDETFVQRRDMTQSLADGICTAEWLAHLRAAQQWYAEQRERGPRHSITRTVGNHDTTAAEEEGTKTRGGGGGDGGDGCVFSNLAGASPYLDQYAALLFSDNTTTLTRLAGTYLAFLPNTTHALLHLRHTMTGKLRLVSLKHAAERSRRLKTHKTRSDHEVVCLPSHLARVELHATMYDTQWLLNQVVFRCLQRRERCLGALGETDDRVWLNMERHLSTTGRWGRGGFRVCLASGVYVADPNTVLP